MIYLDANFFIFALLDNTSKGERARDIHRRIASGGEKAATSPLAIDELMWVLIRARKEHLLRMAVEDIYSTPNLDVTTITSTVPLVALEIIERYKLKPRDAFQIATMKENKLKEILTDDSDFDKVEWVRRIKL